MLSALKQIDFNTFSGIVELDETHFLYSEKGKRSIEGRKPRKSIGSSIKYHGISHKQVCVLIARDRQKATYSGVLGRGRIMKTQLDKVIGSKLSSDNTLCTDAWRFFLSMQQAKDWNIIVLNQIERRKLKDFNKSKCKYQSQPIKRLVEPF